MSVIIFLQLSLALRAGRRGRLVLNKFAGEGTCVISLQASDFSSTARDFLSSMGIAETGEGESKTVILEEKKLEERRRRVSAESGTTLITGSVIKTIEVEYEVQGRSKTQVLELDKAMGSAVEANRLGEISKGKLRIHFESMNNSDLLSRVDHVAATHEYIDRSSVGAPWSARQDVSVSR